MVRAEDASKINRIMERFRLSTVDRASVKATVVREKRGKEGQKAEQPPVPEKAAPKRDELDDLLDQLMKKEPAKEAVIHANPTGARRALTRGAFFDDCRKGEILYVRPRRADPYSG